MNQEDEDFLESLEKAMEEEFEQEMAEISDDDIAAEENELDTLRAERDALQDKFMRALAEAEEQDSPQPVEIEADGQRSTHHR